RLLVHKLFAKRCSELKASLCVFIRDGAKQRKLLQALGSWHRDVLSRQLHDPHPAGPKAQLFCGVSAKTNHWFNLYRVQCFAKYLPSDPLDVDHAGRLTLLNSQNPSLLRKLRTVK